MQDQNFDDDDDKERKGKPGKGRKEFDCPTCEANNPTEDPIKDGSEVRCHYCGNEFLVSLSDTGRMKFKEV